MKSDSDQTSSGGLSGPLGALEFNVLVAGIEGLLWIGVAVAAFWDGALTLRPPDEWKWWYVPATLIAFAGLFVLGLAVEGLAGLFESRIACRCSWYDPCREDPAVWRGAQRWAWKSPQASVDFARRRLRILTCRNTAFNSLVLTLVVLLFFAIRRPDDWPMMMLISIVAGSLLTLLFTYAWVNACGGMRRAASDAGSVDVSS